MAEASLQLLKPSHPTVADSSTYFHVQAAQRREAIRLALGAIADLPTGPDDGLRELAEALRDWTSGTLIQGACLREYHHWEADTKRYFAAVYQRNGEPAPNWNGPGSHVAKVGDQLVAFGLAPAPSMAVLDAIRLNLNDLKHEDGYFATLVDYDGLTEAIYAFWDHVAASEIFAP